MYHFTEAEYLKYLYNEGRCNIGFLDDKPRNELVLIIGRRGTKCESFNYNFYTTEGTISAKELLTRLNNKEKIGIYTYDPYTWEKNITYDLQAEYNGVQEVLRLTTKYGRIDEVTLNHPYLVWRNTWDEPQWVESQNLQIGDRLAVSKSLEIFGKKSIGEDKAKILGYLQGDGGTTFNVGFTNFNKNIIKEIKKIIPRNFKGYILKSTKVKGQYRIINEANENRSETAENKVTSWLKENNAFGNKTRHREIPECIKKAPKNEIAIFLNRLYASDSLISINKPRKQHLNPKASISITLASKTFILDIQKELLKFGIISNWNFAVAKINGKEFDSWRLYISQKDSIIKFADEINIFQKEDKVEKAKQISLKKINQNNPLELLPKGAWNRILNIKKERNLSNAYIIGKHGINQNERLRPKNQLSKDKAKRYAKNINDKILFNLTNSEIYWDSVESLENLGKNPTIALEVKGTNIIGNDIISHNSTIASWVAAYETYKLLKVYHPQNHYKLLPDAEIHLTCVATSEDQANLLFRQILGYYAQSTYFHRYMNKPTSDRIYIRSRRELDKYGEDGRASIVVKSAACSARGVRGPGNIVIIMDEQAHFVDEKTQSNKSDKAIYDAITPSVAQFRDDGKIINISSPLNKSGMLWDLYNQALSGAEQILMIQAPSWEINNTLSTTFLKGRYNQDVITYDCEFGANFSDRVKAWLPEEYLRRVIVPELKQKTNGIPRVPYFVGLDIGLKEDGTAIAISHIEAVEDPDTGQIVDKIELDFVGQRSAGVYPYENYDILDFDMITDWILEVCSKFHIIGGLLDQHNGELAAQHLAKKGMPQFDLIHHTRAFNSNLYQNFMMLCIDRRLRLFNCKPNAEDDDEIIDEILKLQVKQFSKNVIRVEAPKIQGYHDDRSDAIMRSVWLASEALKSGAISGKTNSLANNRYHFIKDANHYRMIKARHHNITDNRRNIRHNRRNAWTNKYGK